MENSFELMKEKSVGIKIERPVEDKASLLVFSLYVIATVFVVCTIGVLLVEFFDIPLPLPAFLNSFIN